jgi:hypothetical protein
MPPPAAQQPTATTSLTYTLAPGVTCTQVRPERPRRRSKQLRRLQLAQRRCWERR